MRRRRISTRLAHFWLALACGLEPALCHSQGTTIIYGRFPVTPEQPPGTFTFPQDSEGWRLLGDTTWPANYSLSINGQLAYTFTAARGVYVTPSSLNALVALPVGQLGDAWPVPLAAGQQIGPDAAGYVWISDPVGGSLLTWTYDGGAGGPESTGLFTGVASAYLGLQFQQDGQTYYGWARVGTPYPGLNIGWLFDYAYQTTPGTPIFAGEGAVPEPSTWALLSAGGILFWLLGRGIRMASWKVE